MALSALNRNSDMGIMSDIVNKLVTEYNRGDERDPLYGTDVGTSTAYAINPIPGITMYTVGQIFEFKAITTNTGTAPTFNVNGKGAGVITYPDGSALAVGDIVSGGTYIVLVSTASPVTFHLLSSGSTGRNRLLQTVSTETGAVASGATIIPFDDTIPQNTEGDQYMTLAITPKSATSNLIIDVVWNGASNASASVLTATLCQDSTANSLAAAWQTVAASNYVISIAFRHIMTSGTTSATTFKVRAGTHIAGTTTFNGQGTVRIYGGVMASSIVIREVLP